MSKTISKQVANRESISEVVISSAETHGGEIVGALERFLFPSGAPQKLTTEKLVQAFGAALSRAMLELRDADLALSTETTDVAVNRNERDGATESVRGMLIDYRSVIGGVYGDQALRLCGLLGDTPRGSEELCNHADNVVRNLRKSPFRGSEPKRGHSALKADAMAEALSQEVDRLRSLLKTTKKEEREYQAALEARNAAMNAWSTTYVGVAQALSGFFTLAGRRDLADRVRPTARREHGQLDEPTVSDETGERGATPGDPGGTPA